MLSKPSGKTMPYKLRTITFAIMAEDTSIDHYENVLVDLQNEGGGEYIAIKQESDKVTINFEEWPLIVEAVERLMEHKSAKEDAAPKKEPAVAKEFLDVINFDRGYALEVVAGDHKALFDAFTWHDTPQGRDYWAVRHDGREKLSAEDNALIQSWIDASKSND
jgi:hypothetical protein